MGEEIIGYTKDGKKIVSASSDKVEELEEHVSRVLECLGHPEAWVTDLSKVYDFRYKLRDLKEPYESHGHMVTQECVPLDLGDKELQELADKLGLESVKPDEYIWQIAQRLKEKDEQEDTSM